MVAEFSLSFSRVERESPWSRVGLEKKTIVPFEVETCLGSFQLPMCETGKERRVADDISCSHGVRIPPRTSARRLPETSLLIAWTALNG